MSLQAFIDQAPAWAKTVAGICVSGCVGVGGWVATIEYRLNDSAKKADVAVMQTAITETMLTKDDFHAYMREFSLEWKRDVQRIEDKLDQKADKP